MSGPGMMGGSTRSGVTEVEVGPDGHTALVPFGAKPESKVRRTRRRGPVALEVEADQIAEAVAAGHTPPAKEPTPTPAASMPVPKSLGRPLDALLLGRLEEALTADLAAVRIHDNAAAGAAVLAEGADAVTAGAHVFFAPGRFRPDTDEGFRLLAHEIVHTLQQTGRRSTDGNLRVTDATGSGPLQAQDAFLDRFSSLSGADIFSELTRLHGGDAVDSPIADLVDELRRALGGAIVPGSSEMIELGDAVVARAFVFRDQQELSYLFDVLKAGQDWNAAAHLVDDNMLFTVAASTTFVQWLVDNRSAAWLRRRVDEHEALRSFRNYVYGAYRIFLVRPDTSPYRVSQDRGENAVGQPAPWNPALSVDDRTTYAAVTVRAIDNNRYDLLRSIHRHIRGQGTGSRTDRALLMFEGKRRAATLNELLTGGPELPAGSLPERALSRFRRQAIAAEDFWSAHLALWQGDMTRRSQIGTGEIEPDTREALQHRLPANSVALRSVARVIASGIQFLDAKNFDVPGFSAYGRRIASYRRVVDRAIDAVVTDLRNFKLDEATRERAEADLWVLQRLIQIGYGLDRYRGPENDEERLAAQRYDDNRQGHRLEMAVELRRLAVELGNADLEDAARAIFENRAGEVTRLILMSDWEKPSSSDLRKLTDDFPRGMQLFDQLEGASPFVLPSAVVRDFYLGDHLLTLADALHDLLQPGGDLAAPNRLVVQEAARVANNIPKPNRWFVERGYWAANDDETRSIAELISQHRKSREQLPPAGVDNRVVSSPAPGVPATPGNVPHEVFTWELPNFNRLLDEVAASLRAVPAIEAVTEPVGVDSLDWLQGLAEIIQNGLISRSLVRTAMGTHMQDRLTEQRRRLGVSGLPPGLLRQGVNHDRLIVAERVRGHLRTYAADATVTNFEHPIDALDLVETFYRYAVPEDDRVAQLAAILIDLAPDLRAAFVRDTWFGMEVNEKRFDIITGWHGLVMLGTTWLGDWQKRWRLVNEFLPADQVVTLGSRTNDLNRVLTSFEDVRSRVQSGIGFRTKEGGLQSLNYPNVIPRGEPFGVEDAFELEQVFKEFTFNPPYGQPGRVIGGVTMGGSSEAQVKDAEGNVFTDDSIVLFRIRVYGRSRTVRVGDVQLLEDIYRAVEDEAFARSMQSTLEALEAMLTLPLDLAEFIPGAGQGLAAARIALSITMFLASAEFDDIKTALSGELIDQIRDLIDNLDDLISPDALWMYLLFGGAGGGMLDRLQNRNPNRRRRRRRTRGKMGRLLRTVGRLGTLMARQFEAMRERIQPPLRNAQSFVNTHPTVAYALNLAALAVEMGVEETVDGIGTAAAGLEERLESMLAALEDFELPAEILPLELLTSAVISLVLDRLGAKGKIAEEILDATGLIDEVSEEIADVLKANGLDVINNMWRTEMKPNVDAVLNEARQDFLDGIYGALELVGVTGIKPTERKITANTGALDLGDGETGGETGDAAAPALAVGFDEFDADSLRTTNGDVIPPGPGAPLPLPVRQEAADRFGRPFDHVRLHRTELGDGVDGLTRGSHVVLRPGLSLTSGRGRRVLHHELVHVLQQSPDAERPTRGRPSTTVRIDPAAEAEADRVAAGGTVPDEFTEVEDDAVAPQLSEDVLANVIRRIASYEDLRAFQEAIQRPTTVLPSLDAQQRTAVERVHRAFLDALPSASAADQIPVQGVPTVVNGATAAEVLAAVRAQARDRVRALFDVDRPSQDFTNLARQALRDVTPRPRPGRSPTQVQDQVFRLEPNVFSALIEGYLLFRSGIVFKVELGRGANRFLEAPAADAFSFRINGLFLGAINRSSGLWGLILDNQLAIGRRVVGNETEAITIDRDNQLDLYGAVKSAIQAYGPRLKALKPTRFEIRSNIVGAAVDRLAAGRKVDPDSLPLPASYTNPHGTIGTFGLRVSDHGQLTSNSVPERDSHHTTQYLLAEFLSNETDYPAFGADGSAVENPGLEYQNGKPMKLHLDGGHVINFGALFPGRGRRMPAIHIAREVHQKADLHVTRGIPDEETDAPASQGGTVYSWYVRDAGAVTRQGLSGSRGAAEARATITDATRDRNRILGQAVERTYRTMRSHMLGRLRDGLLTDERSFYETIAGRGTNRRDADGELIDRWKLSDDQLTRVYDAAEENNDTVMTRYGFRTNR